MKKTVMHIHFWADIRHSAGSVEKVITTFAHYGKKYKHIISCLSDEKTPFLYKNIEIYPFQEDRIKNRIFNKLLKLNQFTYSSLLKKIEQLKPDILHFHNRQELVDHIALKLSFCPKIIVHYHRHFKSPVFPKKATGYIFVSQASKEYFEQWTFNPAIQTSVIYNPVSLNLIELKTSLESIQTKKETLSSCTFLFGGGASPIKGGKELVQAFLKLNHPTARLILAGNQSDKLLTSIPSEKRNHIKSLGLVSAKTFIEYMQYSDIIVMPSLNEAFGLVAQEALFFKKLLVVSSSGGLAEFTGEDCAILIDPTQEDSLVKGLEKAILLLENTFQLNQQLDRGFQKITPFLPERLIKTLESVYDQIC